MPTVIVRPPAHPTKSLNDLTVDVEKIVTLSGDQYALKIVIPDSIKVVELTPVAETESPGTYKIRVAQTGTQFDSSDSGSSMDSVRSRYSMPVHSASDRTIRDEQKFIKPSMQNGFKRNPYYQQSNLDQTTAEFRNRTNSEVVQANAETSNVEHANNLAPPTSMLNETPVLDTPSVESIGVGSTSTETSPTIESPANSQTAELVSEMYGPSDIGLNEEGDFVIYVANRTQETEKEVSVSLDLPAGFDVVLLDRAAEIDADAGRLTWNFESLASGEEHFIRYRVKSLKLGSQNQRVSIAKQSSLFLECEFETNVLVDCTNSSAPFLPFESE